MENLLRKNNIMFHEKERKIKSIIKEKSNKICIDCSKPNPEFISLNNSVFICKSCFKEHQKFSINISKLIKNDLSSLTLKELQYLYFGGNKKFYEFINYEYPKLSSLNPYFIYKTKAMEYYRNWLSYLIEGGIEPIKPDENIAYKSIEDKNNIKNKKIDEKDKNVITIDFYNDCYKYNDKYNRTITRFINEKYSKKNNLMNNKEVKDNIKNENKNRINFKEELKDNMNNPDNSRKYFKIINRNNYNKVINAENINIFSFTQTGFLPQKKQNIEKQKNNLRNTQNNFNTNIILNKNERKNYEKILDKDNNRINNIKTSRSNTKIYVKPKHNIIKSLEKKNNINVKRNSIGLIKVNIAKKSNNIKKVLIENENKVQSNDKYIIKNQKEELNNKDNINDVKSKINNYIESKPKTIRNSFSSINGCISLKTKLIFKKKNLKNVFYIKNNENKHKLICLSTEHSDLNGKRKINEKYQTENFASSGSNNDDTISLNTLRTYSTNKAMKHFYQRNPRKLKKTKRSKRKKQKSEEKLSLKKLKKEKNEILKSLKILMKKKNELDEEDKEENVNFDN